MRLSLVRIAAIATALALAAGFGSYQLLSRMVPVPAQAAIDPVNTALESLNGSPHSLSEWPARYRVVNFWATWCEPCTREIPAFIELQEKYAGRGVQFVGIAVDEREAVAKFAGEAGINYPVLLGDDRALAVGAALGNHLNALPYTVLLGPGSEILHKQYGAWPRADADAYLEGLIATGGD